MKTKKMTFIFLFFFSFIYGDGWAQGFDDGMGYRIMFYNVENLFDTVNDPMTADEEFLPGGMKDWNYYRFRRKVVNVYKTIAACGEWDPPVIIGLCEIENRDALVKLTGSTPLRRFGYRFIHHESPDPRGIDVAMLYRPDRFTVDSFATISVVFPFSMDKTRDILYVRGRLSGNDTLHIFINHWPSRSGGAAGTAIKRIAAANILRIHLANLLESDPESNVVIMGDFNDEPGDESLGVLTAPYQSMPYANNAAIINLMDLFSPVMNAGTIKYDGVWMIFDQMLVSSALLNRINGLTVNGGSAHILKTGFLIEDDGSYDREKPYRTYLGPRYISGFSDHLPVFLELIKRKL